MKRPKIKSQVVVVPPVATLEALQAELHQLKEQMAQRMPGTKRAESVVSLASQDNLIITAAADHTRTVAGASPTGKQPVNNSQREPTSIFDRLGPLGPSQMYPVPEKVLERLRDQTKYVDLGLLLPKNRVESAAPPTQRLVQNERGETELKAVHGKDAINSFSQWTLAFNVFAAYRTFYFPYLSLPLNKYQYWIASYVERGVPTADWLEYDRHFRMSAAAQSYDPTFWTHQDPDCFAEYIERPRHQAATTSKAMDLCRNCGEQGHYIASCPHVVKPKAGRPAQPSKARIPFDPRICRKFNAGDCSTPCKHERKHMCSQCGDSLHGEFACMS